MRQKPHIRLSRVFSPEASFLQKTLSIRLPCSKLTHKKVSQEIILLRDEFIPAVPLPLPGATPTTQRDPTIAAPNTAGFPSQTNFTRISPVLLEGQ